MAESLMRMLMAGPEVSLSGSPTVSPITAATLSSVSLASCSSGVDPYSDQSDVKFPDLSSALKVDLYFSISFLVLSQAPPVLEAEIATWTPETMIPARSPATAYGPNKKPARSGDPRTRTPGAIINLREALVEIEIQPS